MSYIKRTGTLLALLDTRLTAHSLRVELVKLDSDAFKCALDKLLFKACLYRKHFKTFFMLESDLDENLECLSSIPLPLGWTMATSIHKDRNLFIFFKISFHDNCPKELLHYFPYQFAPLFSDTGIQGSPPIFPVLRLTLCSFGSDLGKEECP